MFLPKYNPSMAVSEPERFECYQEIEAADEDYYSGSGGSDLDDDSDSDPSYCIGGEITSKFSDLSIKKKKKARITQDPEEEEEVSIEFDGKSFEEVQNIVEAGRLEKLKLEQCKIYLRKNGLRLTGNKGTLIQRIREHREILNGGGEKKYPVSSFVLNCKGDACTGDVVMFEQTVYEMFSIASRSAVGPPCGTRIVAGRIVKESYGASKQQHTFTIEVLWSKGEKPLPPLHPLLIKGRNLYRLKTLRQRWVDEGKRQKVLMEKHSRGSLARSGRELRIQEKKRRKMLKTNRVLKKDEPHKYQSQANSTSRANYVAQAHKSAPQLSSISTHLGRMGIQTHQAGLCADLGKVAIRTQQSNLLVDPGKLAIRPLQINSQIQDSCHNQIPWNSDKTMGSREVQQKWGDGLHANYRQPNICPNKFPYERNDHRLHLNYHQPMSLPPYRPISSPQRHSGGQPRLCHHYAQGRCYYGENCKFLHELRDFCGQSRADRSLFDQRKFAMQLQYHS